MQTLPEVLAAQKTLDQVYQALFAKHLLTPDIKVVFHEYYNALTELKTNVK